MISNDGQLYVIALNTRPSQLFYALIRIPLKTIPCAINLTGIVAWKGSYTHLLSVTTILRGYLFQLFRHL